MIGAHTQRSGMGPENWHFKQVHRNTDVVGPCFTLGTTGTDYRTLWELNISKWWVLTQDKWIFPAYVSANLIIGRSSIISKLYSIIYRLPDLSHLSLMFSTRFTFSIPLRVERDKHIVSLSFWGKGNVWLNIKHQFTCSDNFKNWLTECKMGH